jgi:hypothetical protein
MRWWMVAGLLIGLYWLAVGLAPTVAPILPAIGAWLEVWAPRFFLVVGIPLVIAFAVWLWHEDREHERKYGPHSLN